VLGLLEEDVAYRARRLLATGLEGVLHDLSPEIAVSQGGLQVGTGGAAHSLVVTGSGLSLMPSAFAWASPTTGVGPGGVSVIYGARGVATLWSRDLSPQQSGADTLAELLGRNRAAILQAVTTPHSTTDLARELGQTPPAVNVHLAILRRSGLVTSRRAGRRVLYRTTPLAHSILDANRASH
jgi:DNA-binding transcriptional ArsR family regulator